MLLPFQLYSKLHWNTIPAVLLAAYIILGIATIGTEIENPFGDEVNDLPLDDFCSQIKYDIDIIMSRKPPSPEEFIKKGDNMVLYPLSMAGYQEWKERSVDDIRAALKTKVQTTYPTRRPTFTQETTSQDPRIDPRV